MKRSMLLTLALLACSSPLLAAQKTVTLGVPGMTCGACPITVKKALTDVKGVIRAEVDYDKRQAAVTYDDTLSSPDQLMRATANAGYPSTIKGRAQ